MSHRLPDPAEQREPAPAAEPATAGHAHTRHGHSHGHASGPVQNLARYAKPVVLGLLLIAAVASAVAVVVLWPSHGDRPIPMQFQSADGGPIATADGSVIAQSRVDCSQTASGSVGVDYPQIPDIGGDCVASVVKLSDGPDAGGYTVLLSPADAASGQRHADRPQLKLGDDLRLSHFAGPDGARQYAFFDYQRSSALIWWAVAFVLAIIGVATWRGLRAIIGLAVAFAVLGYFTLPSILDGNDVAAVAIVSSAVILFVVLYLAHGFSLRTSSALLGTLTSLLMAALLSKAAIASLHLTGLSAETTASLAVYRGSIPLDGLLLAGFVIGTLGVLNDVTITQASATFELAAVPGQSRIGAFRASMRVGRDHIASTVYTLVFAYAGGALPLLLLFSVAGQPFGTLLTGEQVAIELARAFVGGIALALSVPFTTAIAAALVAPPQPAPAAAEA
ncbi:YibE/F family protein [Gordonia sp. VNK21]|uniref:YibE/F family protein n=1 Tax=Gordonia sp. VNK21 TaxID=3382483 RepID=UPI0038D503AD